MTGPKSSYISSFNDVTAQNLDFYYDKLLDKIKDASFIALDFEFTGLCKAKTNDMNHRYIALKKTIESHTIVSMGMSIIQTKTEQTDRVRSAEADPQQPTGSQPIVTEDKDTYVTYKCDNFDFLAFTDTDFSMNESTAQFLVDHHFSFDRLFQQGIRFTTPLVQSKRTEQDSQQSTLAESKQKDRLKLRNMWQTIVSLMKQNDTPLVVHNGLYDIMYLYHSFLGILPETLREFEMSVSNQFPSGIYDTKYLVNQFGSDFNASFLSYLFHKCDRLRQNSFSQNEPSQPYFEVVVNQPILPLTAPASTSPAEEPARGIKRKSTEDHDTHPKRKIVVCKAYAERGYCAKENQGDPLHQSKSEMHDIQLILDHEMGISPYQQAYMSDPDLQIDGAHSAHFDAYMAAFVFCFFRLRVSPEHLRDNINKINIDSSSHPLRLPAPKNVK